MSRPASPTTRPATADRDHVDAPASPRHLGGRLALEWARLRVRQGARRRAGGWGLVDGPVDDLDDVLAAVGYLTPASPAADERLRQLVLIAADDELAARVVVQRILPGLLAVVTRRRRQGAGRDALDELLGAAWIAVRTFNPERRPRCLAAALISDADHRAFRADRRRRSAGELPTDLCPDELVQDTDPHASDELGELLRLATDAGMGNDDLDLVRRLLDAPRVIDLARDLAVTPRTIRNRRDRITGRLRELALAA